MYFGILCNTIKIQSSLEYKISLLDTSFDDLIYILYVYVGTCLLFIILHTQGLAVFSIKYFKSFKQMLYFIETVQNINLF